MGKHDGGNDGNNMSAEGKQAKMSEERAFLTKLMESAVAGKGMVVKSLLNEYSSKHHIPFHTVLSQFKDGSGRTALHFACQSPAHRDKETVDKDVTDDSSSYANEDIVVTLLTKCNLPKSIAKSMAEMKDVEGLTPLMLASQTAHDLTSTRVHCILDILLDKNDNGNDMIHNHPCCVTSKAGATSLHYACASGVDNATLQLLMGNIPQQHHSTNDNNNTSMNNNSNTTATTLSRKLTNTKSTRGGTPLHWASGTQPPSDRTPQLQTLLSYGANVNSTDENGITPLLIAAASGNDRHAALLVQNGADRGAILAGNITIYHVAADLNLIRTMAALMEYRDDVTTSCCDLRNDAHGERPLDLAAQEGHLGCVMMLLGLDDEEEARRQMVQLADTWKLKHDQTKAAKAKQQTEDNADKQVDNNTTPNNAPQSPMHIEDMDEHSAQRYVAHIMSYSSSSSQSNNDNNTKALEHKASGNMHFAKKELDKAIHYYTRAIENDPTDATFHSNRSACYMEQSKAKSQSLPKDGNTLGGIAKELAQRALYDATVARHLRPNWSKACYRVAVARLALGRYEDAAVSAWEGIQIENEIEEQEKKLAQEEKINLESSIPTKPVDNNNKNKNKHKVVSSSKSNRNLSELKQLLQQCVKKGRKDHLAQTAAAKHK
mmetsp:Transcript_10884/g.15328  ORF Transcript_10884/g.15328 Transcript_10884/m.15328 type:complete len:660 (-) Transcript_10884:142-2121(-)